jgi:hypothetical protein
MIYPCHANRREEKIESSAQTSLLEIMCCTVNVTVDGLSQKDSIQYIDIRAPCRLNAWLWLAFQSIIAPSLPGAIQSTEGHLPRQPNQPSCHPKT